MSVLFLYSWMGALPGTLLAVDGPAIQPVRGRRFGIGIAQRCDIRIETPGPGTYPIFGVREGDTVKEGQLLARVDDTAARDEVEIKEAKVAAAEADLVLRVEPDHRHFGTEIAADEPEDAF